ncbi:MAG: hypothetical protein QF546_02915 [Alphaproteobacteria bacterium]|jgi:hypothetical protein|nr:hypothetical protein [Alphaproteobacteria bacterium]
MGRKMPKTMGFAVIVLLGMWPFLDFAMNNLFLGLSIFRLFVAAIGTIAVSLLLWLVFSLLFRRIRPDRWAAIIGSGICVMFLFSALATVMQDYGYFRYSQAFVWVIATATLLIFVWIFSRSKDFILILAIVAVVMNVTALAPLARLLQGPSRSLDSQLSEPKTTTNTPSAQTKMVVKGRLPNVYFFIFDEYDRADQLKKIFNFDNRPFLDALVDRGFVIGERSLANFPATLLSVSSTLSMNYIVPPGKAFDWWGADNRGAKRVIDGYNPVVERFHELGYKYFHGGGENYVRCGNAEDRCIRAKPVTWIREQERLLMLMTPLRLFRYRLRFATEKFTPEVVKKAIKEYGGMPRFVYAHYMIPRSSVYDEECSPVSVLDGMTKVTKLPRHDLELMRKRKLRYLNDIKCLNPSLIGLVDTILSDDKDPIIILQSDHGSTFLHDWKTPEWPDDEFLERYGILNAIRLPDRCRHQLYPTMTSVNTFRIVFACIEDRPPRLLDDISLMIQYYSKDPVLVRKPGTLN